jgi:hypothetical protein
LPNDKSPNTATRPIRQLAQYFYKFYNFL